ncbi:MAG: OB-fold nucleic acid binding domain-containing protein [Candidatus Jordarchaeales archaeon]
MSFWEPARKLRISEVIGGSVENPEPGKFVLTTKSGIKTGKVRVMGTVVDVFRSEIGNYVSFTLDDGTGTIRVKVWRGKDVASNINIGDIVDVAGLVRVYKGEVYLVPELIIKVEDPNWELVRELEILVFQSLLSETRPHQRKTALLKGIIKIIDSLDTGNGVSKSTLGKLLNVAEEELENALDLLLREGIIYETDNGYYKRLGNLDESNGER